MPFANDRARSLWARTRVRVWPDRYVLASLAPSLTGAAMALLGQQPAPGFTAVVLERDEVSVTLPEVVWASSQLPRRAEAGPFRVVTLDLDLDLDVCGFLAPAAAALAAAGIPIVPQCAFLKDHLLVPEAHLEAAVRVLEGLSAEAKG